MKNKLFSIFTALAMVLGILVSPFKSAQAAGEADPATIDVKVHKILMNNTDMKDHDSNKKYDPSKGIENLKQFFGDSAEEIPNVSFIAIKEGEQGYDNFNDLSLAEKKAIVEAQGARVEETTANGAKFTLENGTEEKPAKYKIYEVEYKSTYKSDEGKVLTNSKAVPVELELPTHAKTENGTAKEINVYPKNTEDKPQIDKNFEQGNKLTEAQGNFEDSYTNGETVDQTGDIDHGADYDNYQKKKKIANGEVGKEIPYEVKTEIPAQSRLELAKWDDNMDRGLTYTKGSLEATVQVGDAQAEELTAETDYTLTETDSGFVMELTEDGLKKVNGKDQAVTVKLTYKATVNSDAVVDMPQNNDVKFNYGNNPSKETKPVPTKPKENGELKVIKTWDDGKWAKGEEATFELRDAETGRKVTADDLVKPEGMSKEDWENAKKDFKAEVTIGYDAADGGEYTWKYLNKDKQYVAVETNSVTMSDAEYDVDDQGNITVTNHKSTNPKPLNPTEPKVVVGGKKFVKTNQDASERLAGAEFFVKNTAGQYLVATERNAKAVEEAKAALDDAVKTYNGLDAKAQTQEEKNKVDEAQAKYNKVFKENASAYTWGNKTDAGVVKLVSDAEGRLEITGLEYADGYKLEEDKAPAGYAKLTKDVEFKVEQGSYSTKDVNINYNKEDKSQSAKQIENKKVTIPQTGGIGSLIFVVAGLAIMAFAFTAYKKSQYQEA